MARLAKELKNAVQGEKFIRLADCCYCPAKDDMYLPKNETVRGKIIYAHTHHVAQLFECLRQSNFKKDSLTVISHNSDFPTPHIAIPDCVKKWFSQNVTYVHEKLESIPIGLENNRWFPEVRKKRKMLKQLRKKKRTTNILYLNFNIQTNPKERKPLYDYYAETTYVTMELRKNGEDFEDYIRNVYCHDFVLCPNGNGIDTHRLWETFYMSSFPIVRHSANIQFYKDKLPMLVYFDIDGLFSRSQLEKAKEDLLGRDWKYELLNFEYWSDKIRSLS